MQKEYVYGIKFINSKLLPFAFKAKNFTDTQYCVFYKSIFMEDALHLNKLAQALTDAVKHSIKLNYNNSLTYGVSLYKTHLIWHNFIPKAGMVEVEDFITADQVFSIKSNILYILENGVELKEEIKEEVQSRLLPGMVTTHADGDGNHTAIILSVKYDLCKVLFLTGSEYISDSYREASEIEVYLTGIRKVKTTYLALVERRTEEFYYRGIMYPEYRVKDLIKEFLEEE